MTDTNKHWLFRKTTVVLGGASIRGLAYLGALHCFSRFFASQGRDMSSQIQRWVGTSIGAFVSLIMCTDPDMDAVCEYFVRKNMMPINEINPVRFIQNHGLIANSFLRNMVRDFLLWRYDVAEINRAAEQVPRVKNLISSPFSTEPTRIDNDLSFAAFELLTGKKLVACVTKNASCGARRLIYDGDSNPNLSVIDAVACSMSIPFIFVSWRDPEDLEELFDGGIIDGLPCLIPEKFAVSEALIFMVNSSASPEHPSRATSLPAKFIRCVSITAAQSTRNLIARLDPMAQKTILVIPVQDVGTMEFNITHEKRRQLIERGKHTGKNFLIQHYYAMFDIATSVLTFAIFRAIFPDGEDGEVGGDELPVCTSVLRDTVPGEAK